jgi:hypothetical protein
MSSAEDKRVLDFLDRMNAKHGAKKSFLTSGRQMSAHHHWCSISIGSEFWPITRPELVTYLLESLQEARAPFVLAFSSPFAQLPPPIVGMLDSQEDACISKLAPQWAVLDHPSTGFFMVHILLDVRNISVDDKDGVTAVAIV